MELRRLRYFVAVAEELNFHRAAERLRVAQPALSAQIKALEDELNVRLLTRTTRSVVLTQAGRVFLNEAHDLLRSAGRAEQIAQRVHQGIAGTLRVGVIAPSVTPWFAKILRKFHSRFPDVQLSLFELTSPEQLRLLRKGELDAGLLRPPVNFSELAWRFVEESPLVLAAPAGHRLTRKRRLEWRDFDGEGLVMISPGMQHGFYDAFLAACVKAGAETHPTHYAQNVQIKMWLISAGFGIAPTTATLAEVKRPGLVFRPLPPGLPPVRTAVVWRRHDSSPVIGNFLECFNVIKSRDGKPAD